MVKIPQYPNPEFGHANDIINRRRRAFRDDKSYGAYLNSPTNTGYRVNLSSVLASLEDMGQVGRELLQEAAIEMETLGRELLENVVSEACDNANVNGGFAEPFQRHVIKKALSIPFEVLVTTQTIFISYDFKYIGDSDDLSKAFHQGAKLADGEYLWEEYTGQTLKQPDASKRYPIWEDIFSGVNTGLDNGEAVAAFNQDLGTWEDTMQQRIKIWGKDAPEWTYVQFGQYQYEPIIPAQSMVEDFNKKFITLCTDILETKIAEMFGIIKAYQNGVGLTPIYKNGKLTVARLMHGNAGVGPSGRLRQPGQFYSAKP